MCIAFDDVQEEHDEIGAFQTFKIQNFSKLPESKHIFGKIFIVYE